MSVRTTTAVTEDVVGEPWCVLAPLMKVCCSDTVEGTDVRYDKNVHGCPSRRVGEPTGRFKRRRLRAATREQRIESLSKGVLRERFLDVSN